VLDQGVEVLCDQGSAAACSQTGRVLCGVSHTNQKTKGKPKGAVVEPGVPSFYQSIFRMF